MMISPSFQGTAALEPTESAIPVNIARPLAAAKPKPM
jgi:hypothetical protein